MHKYRLCYKARIVPSCESVLLQIELQTIAMDIQGRHIFSPRNWHFVRGASVVAMAAEETPWEQFVRVSESKGKP